MTYLEILNNKNFKDIKLLSKLQMFDKEHPIEELIDLIIELNPQTCEDKDNCPGLDNISICDSNDCYKNDEIEELKEKIEELEEEILEKEIIPKLLRNLKSC